MNFIQINMGSKRVAEFFCPKSNDEGDIKKFFSKLDDLLSDVGKASLNYYHQDHWGDAVEQDLFLDEPITYKPSFDLSRISENLGVWVDQYFDQNGKKKEEYRYKTRIHTDESIQQFISHTNLELPDKVLNFGKNEDEVIEPGWVDYVFYKI